MRLATGSTSMLVLLLVLFASGALAQDGSLDTGFGSGAGADNSVYLIRQQSDGKIVIGGWFTNVGGVARAGVARLNTNGSLDTTFDPGTGVTEPPNPFAGLYALALDSNGKILIGGQFTYFNGVARNRIARLNTDGTLDTTFDPGTGANDLVLEIAIESSGKILIGGYFTSFDGTSRVRVARLNADGSLDTTFDPGTGVTGLGGQVGEIEPQPNGKLIIGGDFAMVNGTARSRIARLNSDGSLDTTFDPGSGADLFLYSVMLQPNGQVLISGGFSSYNGVARSGLALLNADGSLDTSFDPGVGANNSVLSLVYQPDGKYLVGGRFSSIGGVSRPCVARLHSTGSVDTSFDPGTGPNDQVYELLLQPDGKVLIGGWFTMVGTTSRNRIARLLNPSLSAPPTITSTPPAAAVVGQAYSYQVVATGTPTISYSVSGNPSWLTLTGNTLAGTPGAGDVGTTPQITVTATNSFGSAPQNYAILVTGPPVITSSAPAAATAGQLYSYAVTTSGTAPISFALSGQPSWLSVSGNIVSGTPSIADAGSTGTITLTATNSVGSDQELFAIAVSAPPDIVSNAPTAATVSQAYSYTLSATGAGPISYSVSNQPAWLILASNVLSGTPSSADQGTHPNITITATNAYGSDSEVFTLIVSTPSGPGSGSGGGGSDGGGGGCVAHNAGYLWGLVVFLAMVCIARVRLRLT